MGVRPSVFIETPAFNPDDWKYLSGSSKANYEYGMFRTLLHHKTGQKVDEYDFVWASREQYEYYLRSFNWRHQQTNVVNTKFIVECSKDQICSQQYTAQVYVEHMLIRLSELSDIPFPDNLYVLMEGLEGYSQIYEHSKYFRIEENQICVDAAGHIKVWVNRDLSLNYPNMEDAAHQQQKGQEDMVDELVRIVTKNTDDDTEPSPTFGEYFQLNKGEQGRNFQETKGLVLSYAKQNKVDIPARFQAVLNLDRPQQSSFRPASMSKPLSANNRQYNTPLKLTPVGKLNDGVTYLTNNQPVNYYFPHPQLLPWNQPQQILAQPNFPYQPMFPIVYQQQPPFYHMQPMMLSLRPNIVPQSQIMPNGPQFVPFYVPNPQPAFLNIQNIKSIPLFGIDQGKEMGKATVEDTLVNEYLSPQRIQRRQANPNVHSKILGAAAYSVSTNKMDHQSQQELPEQQSQRGQSNPVIQINGEQLFYQSAKHKKRINNDESMSEEDDVAMRSLPIKGYPSNTNLQLANLKQDKRQAYDSKIAKEAWQINYDSFGLADNSQKRLRGQYSPKKQASPSYVANHSKQHQGCSMKYFVGFDQQIEIDHQIAADIAQYLS